MRENNAPILEVCDLTKVYTSRPHPGAKPQSVVAADQISWQLPAAGSLAIVGESGSGKSTVARLIVGLELATSGTVKVEGDEWRVASRQSTRERRRRGGIVQMVFQDPYQSLNRRLSIAQCLNEALQLHTGLTKKQRQKRITELMDAVKLSSDRADALPRELSGGQQQRVAIARALAAKPKVLILDEAVSALDVSVQAQVLELLTEIRGNTGVSLLSISHDLAVVQQICNSVVVMRRGQIVETGTVDKVLGTPQHAYTQRLINSIPRRGWKPQRRHLDIATNII